MGIPEAKKVYENTYGVDATRVIKLNGEKDNGGIFRFKKQSQQTLDVDFSLDLVDLPTYNISYLTILGKDIANNILNGKQHMGQLLLFVSKCNGQIVDWLHDEYNVVTEDDINCPTQKRTIQQIKTIAGISNFHMKNTVKVFYCKMTHLENKMKIGVKRVPVLIPTSQAEVDRLIKPPLTEMMSLPTENYKLADYESVNYWLNKHEVIKKRQVLNNSMLMASNLNTSPLSRFRDAFYAGELEGLILLYAARMVQVIRNLLKSKNSKGRYTVFFMDGQPPAIKKLTRQRRQQKRQNTIDKKKKLNEEDAATEHLLHTCKRMMICISQGLMTTAIFDAMRTPLVTSIGSKGLYLSTALFSEAEDDIVRLVSCILDLETPVNHFSLLNKKTLVEYDTSNISKDKKIVKWNKIYSLLKTHTIDQKQNVTVNMFSHDSDMLAKWNLMVSHHRNVCGVMRQKYKSKVKLRELKFYRTELGGGNNNILFNGNVGSNFGIAPKTNSGGITVYDLSESPVFLTPESTLLIMLTKGSDYNTSLVSDFSYDAQIRREVAMFEKLSCTCISGWKLFFEEQKYFKEMLFDIKNCGNISEYNISRHKCANCNKKLVMPFWLTKFMFVSQAVDFIHNPKHLCFPPTDKDTICNDIYKKLDLHRALAANASANVMAYLTLGSFNQRIFGSINTFGNIIKNLSENDHTEHLSATPESLDDKNTMFSGTLNAMIKKKRKTDNQNTNECLIASSVTKNFGALKKKTSPIKYSLSLSIYNSVVQFFNFHTDGGITTCRQDDLHAEKSFLFNDTFDNDAHQQYTEDEKREIEMLSASQEFLSSIISQDDDDCSSKDSTDGGYWLEMARKVFEQKSYNGDDNKEDFFTKYIKVDTPTASLMTLSPRPSPKFHVGTLESPPRFNSTEPEEKLKYKEKLSWKKLAEEFEKCLSVNNIEYSDNSLLSKMSGLLMTYNTVWGIDDIRTSGLPYMIKTMNLLMILYLNMCGLEDNEIVNGDGQLMPIIHNEYFAGEKCNTDRINFMAAVLEYTMMQYKPEIGPASNIKQRKRQKWEPLLARMSVLDKYTDVCKTNCLKLSQALGDSLLTWLPNQRYFMPVLGLAVPKPWTPLSLWASFIHYREQQQQQQQQLSSTSSHDDWKQQ
uniref:Wsv139-like protein n=1 Tax=Pasiphaea japonica whispovirus TaxID=2984286 RepID=A0A9C7BP24_9VIRU|nr:MAG: wsv139-like protein [Pasiphaea japonica whispovirus]